MPTATVRKAVITAAGRGTRQYPATNVVQKELFPLVDRDGITKPVIQIVAEEAVASGIEQLCVVTTPDQEASFRRHFRPLNPAERHAFTGKEWAADQSDALDRLGRRIFYVHQGSQEGFGHAVHCARDFVAAEPFLLMLGDHIYISREERRCARQLLDAFERHASTVSSVQRTLASGLHLFGTAGAEPLPGEPGLYRVTELKEKPTPDYAKTHLRVAGLGPDEYLCFFGMHVFTPAIFDCIEELIETDARERGEIQLTSAQELLRRRQPYLACEINGLRCDMGVPEGLLYTQTALALHSPFAADVRQWASGLPADA